MPRRLKSCHQRDVDFRDCVDIDGKYVPIDDEQKTNASPDMLSYGASALVKSVTNDISSRLKYMKRSGWRCPPRHVNSRIQDEGTWCRFYMSK